MTTFIGGLTEDQIERKVSTIIDRIDAAFMKGSFNQAEYDRRIEAVTRWADREYRFRTRAA